MSARNQSATKPVRRLSTAKPARNQPVKPVRRLSTREVLTAHRHAWSHAGVIMCVSLSACLNGYANSTHAPMPIAGWMLGIMIPCIVFVLAKVAGMQYRVGARRLAYFTASMGLGLLLLSIYHCACSLAILSGCTLWLAVPMAVAIDGGLVACELDLVLS